jgi:hypothetical protein
MVAIALPIKVVGVLLDDVIIIFDFICFVVVVVDDVKVFNNLFKVVSINVCFKVDVEVELVEVKIVLISIELGLVSFVVCLEVEISVLITNKRTSVHEIFSLFKVVQHS